MKYLLIIPFVFVSFCVQAQQTDKDKSGNASIDAGIMQIKTSAPMGQPRLCSTFKSYNDVSQHFTMKRQALPGELLSLATLLNPGEAESQVSIYSTNMVQMGNFKFSCDYIFDEEGRLIDCEPTWIIGK